MKTFENELDEMIDAVIKLAWSFTIFRALFERNDADREAREAHPEFFLTMHDSLFCGFCVTTALLFEEHKEKATSICRLVKESKPELAENLNQKIRANRRSIDELEKIRHQVCAHRWKRKNPEEVLDETRPCLSMMKDVVELARFIICGLADDAGGNRKENLEKQQLSKSTLECVANDASQVMRAFAQSD